MSEAVLDLLTDKGRREAISQAGRHYVEQHHSFEDTVKKYETLYLHWANLKMRRNGVLPAKQRAKAALGNTCDLFGILKVSAKAACRSIQIINYHRVLHAHELPRYLFAPMVVSTTVFERQMDFFRRRCHVLSLAECVEIIENHLPIPENAVVLTFDDGYRELYFTARPILEKYELPVTVFLTTGFIGQNAPIWYDAIGQRLQMADGHTIRIDGAVPHELSHTLRRLRAAPAGMRSLLARAAVHQIVRLPLGVVFQNLRRGVAFQNVLVGVDRKAAGARGQVADTLARFGVDHLHHQPDDVAGGAKLAVAPRGVQLAE
jgi:hypothetical protein